MKAKIIAIVMMLAFVCGVNAKTSEVSSVAELTSINSDYDGVYSGKATPSKMNGIDITSGKSYACKFTISNGILSGNFTVGPHTISLESTQQITGTGTYVVKGKITLANVPMTFSGTISVTQLNGTTLDFSAKVNLDFWGTESDFTFTGSKQ